MHPWWSTAGEGGWRVTRLYEKLQSSYALVQRVRGPYTRRCVPRPVASCRASAVFTRFSELIFIYLTVAHPLKWLENLTVHSQTYIVYYVFFPERLTIGKQVERYFEIFEPPNCVLSRARKWWKNYGRYLRVSSIDSCRQNSITINLVVQQKSTSTHCARTGWAGELKIWLRKFLK